MSLLRSSDVLWYHPFDDTTEYTKNHAWDDAQFNIGFTSGIVVSGLTRDNVGVESFQIQESLADGGYPDISGATRFTVCMWASGFYQFSITTKKITIGFQDSLAESNVIILTKDSSSVLTFGLKIRDTLVGTKTISTKPTTSSWNFAVLDAEKEGTDWRFRVSFNGADWQDLGTDTYDFTVGGNLEVLVNMSDTGSASSFGVDEVVVWKDVDLFTSTELSNLYELANTHDSPMQQYSSHFVDMATQSSTLYIQGSDNAACATCVALYIKGIAAPTPSGEQARVIDYLTKTQDFDPQLIGTFTIPPSSVNIEVWDIVNGQNSPMTLVSSGCYAIGDTGRWGWSTANLPFTNYRDKYQYYYRMISNESESQYGEFFITVPEDGRWSYRDWEG